MGVWIFLSNTRNSNQLEMNEKETNKTKLIVKIEKEMI